MMLPLFKCLLSAVMAKTLSFFIILRCYGLVWGSWANPSSREYNSPNVRECYSDLEKENDISHLLLDTTSLEDIDAFCRRITKLNKCVADHEHQLSISENTKCLQKTRGVTVFYLNVCPPGSNITEKYRENSPCFGHIKKQIIFCASSLPDISYSRMENDSNRICCALKRHRVCAWEAVFHNCGKEAGEVIDQILLRYFGSQLRKCYNRTPVCPSVDEDRRLYNVPGQSLDHPPEAEDWHFHAEERRRHKSSGNIQIASTTALLLSIVFVSFSFVFLQ